MKTVLRFVIGIVLGLGMARAENHSPGGLRVTLERLEKPLSFQLSVRNTGSANVVVVRPRARMVDTYGDWGGWSLDVQGPGGAFRPIAYPGGVEPFTSADLIELRPGESVGVVIDLGRFTRDNKTVLETIPGDYVVAASYRLPQGKVISAQAAPLRFSVPRK